MKNTILPGDYIFLNKVKYGPVLNCCIGAIFPKRESWESLIDRLSGNRRMFKNELPKRGDVICLKKDRNSNEILLKRCVGISGDTIEFKKCRIAVNGVDDSLTYDSYNDVLSYNNLKNSISKLFINTGKVKLPIRGDKIKIDSLNYSFYEKMIKEFENNEIKIENNKIYINAINDNYYTFKNSYYFVMGDNRAFSIDSRHFGPIPESAIIGEATHVLFSWSKNNPFIISRILKKIQ